MEENCYVVEPAVDVVCVEYGTQTIDRVLYTAPDQPLEPPTPSQGQTAEQVLATYLATRMALQNSDPAKIHVHKVKKGQMPFASPVYKTDPHTGVRIPSNEDTDMKFEGTDYRNNDNLYDFYGRINDGRQYLAWGGQGKHLIGGLKGLLGGFTALAGVIEGAEMVNQIKWEFNWKGSPVPDRVRIP